MGLQEMIYLMNFGFIGGDFDNSFNRINQG